MSQQVRFRWVNFVAGLSEAELQRTAPSLSKYLFTVQVYTHFDCSTFSRYVAAPWFATFVAPSNLDHDALQISSIAIPFFTGVCRTDSSASLCQRSPYQHYANTLTRFRVYT